MQKLLKEKIDKIVSGLGYEIGMIKYDISEPPQRELGDFATNIALILAGKEKQNPREVAQKIVEILKNDRDITGAEIAGPGFINISFKNDLYTKQLKNILIAGDEYGRSDIGKSEAVNVEYVSANPTGPLHVGNGRSGPIGKTIANVLKFTGHQVTEEFYINDWGNQVAKFGKTLLYWHKKSLSENPDFPEGGYPGEYMKEAYEEIVKKFANEIKNKSDDELISFLTEKGLDITISWIKADLKLIGVEIDVWTRESRVAQSGEPDKIIEKLKTVGATAEKGGALWLRQPDDPDLKDQDAVLIKSDQAHSITYFANDIAYHIDKLNRLGNDKKKLIDLWGANHSGHIKKMRAAMRLLGYSEDVLEIILYQYVRLMKNGEAVSMGKRLGNFVTLRQVIEAGVSPDAFKYFILAQNMNTPMEFDIELAADTSEKNPVFYIKYAHARICSILRKAGEETSNLADTDLSLLSDAKEQALYKELVKFPELISEISENFQIQSLPHFAYKIATLFHDFYGTCQVIGVDEKLSRARLSLITATKIVLKNALNLCGIEAPEKM